MWGLHSMHMHGKGVGLLLVRHVHRLFSKSLHVANKKHSFLFGLLWLMPWLVCSFFTVQLESCYFLVF